MPTLFHTILMTLVVTFAVVAPASAQSGGTTPAGASPMGSVGFTYSLLRVQEATGSTGVGIDFSRRVTESANGVGVHIAADVSVNRFAATDDFDAATQSSFMVGVRLVGGAGHRAQPFAQVLAGGIHCCGATDPGVMFGGGLDVRAGNKINVRIQIDAPVDFYKAGVDEDEVPFPAGHQTGFRFNVGISIPIR